jgi:endonuclease/exonuclease/phosphatase family metal-dependent hydrolase
VGRVRAGEFARLGAPAGAPLVVLAQEAYRADDSVPAASTGAAGRVLIGRLRPAEDVVDAARALGLNLRYVPSMRNGADRSDRGNAILSTLPLTDVAAVELPLVLQRRVAVGATVVAPGGLAVRVCSGHLDPRGPRGRDWLGAAGRALQAAGLLAALPDGLPAVLGADLNLGRGRREPAWRLLAAAGFTTGVPPREPAWRHTYHGVPRLNLDYLLVRDGRGGDGRGDGAATITAAVVHRLDEHPRDAGPYVFGSDHHPLLARVELATPEARAA